MYNSKTYENGEIQF